MEQLVMVCLSDPDGAVCGLATAIVKTWPVWGACIIANLISLPLLLWLMWGTITSVRKQGEEDTAAIIAAIRAGRDTAYDVAQRRASDSAAQRGP